MNWRRRRCTARQPCSIFFKTKGRPLRFLDPPQKFSGKRTPMLDLKSAVLAMLRECWDGHPYRLRKNKLAALLDRPVNDIRAALSSLRDAGEIKLESSRSRGGPHVSLLRAPAEHKATRLSNFKHFSQPQE
jgi:hypothetical protein